MKKLLKSAFFYFISAIGIPELLIVTAEGNNHTTAGLGKNRRTPKPQLVEKVVKHPKEARKKSPQGTHSQKGTSQPPMTPMERLQARKQPNKIRELKQTLAYTKEELKRLREKMAQISELSQEAQNLISETRFMCICPTPDEFTSVYRSLKRLEPGGIFKEYSDIDIPAVSESTKMSYEVVINELKRKLYNEDNVDLREGKINGELQPICFFKHQSGEVLCVARGGKGFKNAGVFGTKAKIFKNVRYPLICGICACPKEEFTPGTLFFCSEYVELSDGVLDSAHPDESLGIIQTDGFYYKTVTPTFFETDTSLVTAIGSGLSGSLFQAISVSAENFVARPDLAKRIASRVSEIARTTPAYATKCDADINVIIEMESAVLASIFASRGLKTYSLRAMSDSGDSREKGFSIPQEITTKTGSIKGTGKEIALSVLENTSGTLINCWITYEASKKDELATSMRPLLPSSSGFCKKRPRNVISQPASPSCKQFVTSTPGGSPKSEPSPPPQT